MPSYRPSFERGAAARVRHRGVVVGLSPLPRPAALHQLCSNRQQQAVAAIIRYAKEHVSLRAPFLLFSISSTPDRLCTSSVACPHLPPLLFFGASHGLHWQAAVQRRRSCHPFPRLHCFSATRTSRDTLLQIGDMTALKTATPLSPSSPSSPRRYHRHYRQVCHHCHRRRSCSREVAAACAHLQLHTQRCSCSRAAAARRFVRSTENESA